MMLDPTSPDQMKGLVREQNAVGLLMLQQLLVAFGREEREEL